ncbi:MAG: POTRA domain-containing protein [Planctomycetota bacterium]
MPSRNPTSWLVERVVLSLALLAFGTCVGQAQSPYDPQSSVAPEQLPAPQGPLVAQVRITGNETVKEDTIFSYLRTRKDRLFDPETLQADKRRLTSSGLFREVRIYTQEAAEGMVVTFEVFERPTIREIEFRGNRGLTDRTLLKQCGLKVGDALNFYAIEEARRKIEDYYRSKGFPKAEISIIEGNEAEHRAAVFAVAEGPLQRIEKVEFVGNQFVSGKRLETQIQSKPGYLYYLLRGKVDLSKVEADVEKLTAYYRSFGFFKARIGRELDFDDDNKWLTLRFVIDEGPQFVVRNVSVFGNSLFDTPALEGSLNLQSGQYFNQGKMDRDVNTLRDVYGGQGYIFADIKAEPRFSFENPGELDLVYNVTEGEQFRVGRINVHIAGEFPHTRESVILDRLSIRPGDIVDIREVRSSERRLKASQLFETDPQTGKEPRVVIRPPDLNDARTATQPQSNGTVRGQSPDYRELDIDIYVDPNPLQTERPQSAPSPYGTSPYRTSTYGPLR